MPKIPQPPSSKARGLSSVLSLQSEEGKLQSKEKERKEGRKKKTPEELRDKETDLPKTKLI